MRRRSRTVSGYYESHGRLSVLDGVGELRDVQQRILSALPRRAA